MSQDAVAHRVRFVNSLLGVVLILTAGLDILVLGLIGWATWDRATLADRIRRMEQEDVTQLAESQAEAQQLRALIAAGHEAISASASMLPDDAEIGRFVIDLRSSAASLGITITELGPQPGRPASIPTREFVIRASGEWNALQQFLLHTAQALSSCRIESLTLWNQGGSSEMECVLSIAARPLDPTQLSSPAGQPTLAP